MSTRMPVRAPQVRSPADPEQGRHQEALVARIPERLAGAIQAREPEIVWDEPEYFAVRLRHLQYLSATVVSCGMSINQPLTSDRERLLMMP